MVVRLAAGCDSELALKNASPIVPSPTAPSPVLPCKKFSRTPRPCTYSGALLCGQVGVEGYAAPQLYVAHGKLRPFVGGTHTRAIEEHGQAGLGAFTALPLTSPTWLPPSVLV